MFVCALVSCPIDAMAYYESGDGHFMAEIAVLMSETFGTEAYPLGRTDHPDPWDGVYR